MTSNTSPEGLSEENRALVDAAFANDLPYTDREGMILSEGRLNILLNAARATHPGYVVVKREVLEDADTSLTTLCARYGYEKDGITPSDWSEWIMARDAYTTIRQALAATPVEGRAVPLLEAEDLEWLILLVDDQYPPGSSFPERSARIDRILGSLRQDACAPGGDVDASRQSGDSKHLTPENAIRTLRMVAADPSGWSENITYPVFLFDTADLIESLCTPQASPSSGWRADMENAPRDGTAILGCWLLPDREPLFGVVAWAPSDEEGADSEEGWIENQRSVAGVTHWMPLPDAPVSGRAG